MAERAWLVTGGSGQVGGALAAAPPAGVKIVAPPRAELDLAEGSTLDIAPLIAAQGITAIVNCGAYTNVERAEDEARLAHRINADAAGALARAARKAEIPLVQISTDYVFSGDKPAPYDEADATAPGNVYGRSKLAGEAAVAASGARHAILRTAWVFSPHGGNFVKTMLRLGEDRPEITVVSDQLGCPTHAGDLAAAVAQVTSALEEQRCGSGIWHVVNNGETSWHGFAACIFARAALHRGFAPRLHPIAAADFPTRARRPANSRLATGKLLRDFGIAMRDWQSAADETVDAILAGEAERAGA